MTTSANGTEHRPDANLQSWLLRQRSRPARPSQQAPKRAWLSRLRRFPEWLPMVPVLGLLAFADAFVFWDTLSKKFKAHADLVLIFVLALSVAAIAASHAIGRRARRHRAGDRTSIGFIAGLATLWISLGLIVAYIRTQESMSDNDDAFSELDAPTEQAAVATTEVQVAALMFVLYMITGLLAMAYGYRFSDQFSRPLRAMLKYRQELNVERARLEKQRHEAELRREEGLNGLESVDQVHAGMDERLQAIEIMLKQSARTVLAAREGDPGSTDELFHPPVIKPVEQTPTVPTDDLTGIHIEDEQPYTGDHRYPGGDEPYDDWSRKP